MIHALLVVAVILIVLWLLFHATGGLINLIWLVIIVLIVLWLVGFIRDRSARARTARCPQFGGQGFRRHVPVSGGQLAPPVLAFAPGCLLSSDYGFLTGAWPFGIVEAVWYVVALQRFRTSPVGVSPAPL